MNRWTLAPLVLGLGACNGGGHNASGTWEGVATNRSYPYDAVIVRLILRDQGGVLSGSHHALLDVGWAYVGEVRGTRSGQEASWRMDAPNGCFPLSGPRSELGLFLREGAFGPKDGGASGGRAVSRVALEGRRGLW